MCSAAGLSPEAGTDEDLFGLKSKVDGGDGAIRAREQQMSKPPK
jgi:hypothetical protein